MARLDMSDVLTDPDLSEDGLVRIRRAQTIGSDGIAVDSELMTTFSGVVTAGKGDGLVRTPDGGRAVGNMVVTTVFDLLPNAPGQDGDIVVWRDRRYLVDSISDYRNFGYIAAACILLPLTG